MRPLSTRTGLRSGFVDYVWAKNGRRRALAEVVGQCRETHRQTETLACGPVDHPHDMHAGIDFGMMFGRLRHPEQAVDFREEPGQRTAVAQHLEHARRLRFHQAARDFLPHPLGHQRVDFAVVDHPPHQRAGFRSDGKVGETGGEARHPQDAHRIFGKRLAHMAKNACSQIVLSAIGIDQRAGRVLGHRVDGEVAAAQILFQGDVRCGVHLESLVALSGFALGTRQGVFLVRLRVQEYREILADRLVAQRDHVVGRGADDDVVAVGQRQAQQPVTHCAADDVGFHGGGRA